MTCIVVKLAIEIDLLHLICYSKLSRDVVWGFRVTTAATVIQLLYYDAMFKSCEFIHDAVLLIESNQPASGDIIKLPRALEAKLRMRKQTMI